MKPKMLIFMGGPGVGKGTFAKMLRATHNFSFWEAGATLRAQPADSPVAQILARGDFVPDELVCDLLREFLATARGDVMLDGFPRNLNQAQWLTQNLADAFDICVLYLYADDDTLRARIKKRAADGAQRTDDDSDAVINHRIENFHKLTVPAVEWLRGAKNVKFAQVDAVGSVDENWAEIVGALGDCEK